MTWWEWTLIWVLLGTGALWVLFVAVRSLWRKAVALAEELGTAGERLSAVADELQTINAQVARVEELAVFADPGTLRQQRIQARRAGRRRSGTRRDRRGDRAGRS